MVHSLDPGAPGRCARHPTRNSSAQHKYNREAASCPTWIPQSRCDCNGGKDRWKVQTRKSDSPLAPQANSSSITFPPPAIFMGRPLLEVKVLASEMSIAWHTVDIRSSLL